MIYWNIIKIKEISMTKKICLNVLENLKLENICVYNLKNKSPFFDYLICATSNSERQANAVFEHLKKKPHKIIY